MERENTGRTIVKLFENLAKPTRYLLYVKTILVV